MFFFDHRLRYRMCCDGGHKAHPTKNRYQCLLLAESHHRPFASSPPIRPSQTVRQGSTLWNGQCGERLIDGPVTGKDRLQRFLRIAKSPPHPALRATFSPRCGEKESTARCVLFLLPALRGEGGRRPDEGRSTQRRSPPAHHRSEAIQRRCSPELRCRGNKPQRWCSAAPFARR